MFGVNYWQVDVVQSLASVAGPVLNARILSHKTGSPKHVLAVCFSLSAARMKCAGGNTLCAGSLQSERHREVW